MSGAGGYPQQGQSTPQGAFGAFGGGNSMLKPGEMPQQGVAMGSGFRLPPTSYPPPGGVAMGSGFRLPPNPYSPQQNTGQDMGSMARQFWQQQKAWTPGQSQPPQPQQPGTPPQSQPNQLPPGQPTPPQGVTTGPDGRMTYGGQPVKFDGTKYVYDTNPLNPGAGQFGNLGAPGAGGFTLDQSSGKNMILGGANGPQMYNAEGLVQGGQAPQNYVNWLNSYGR